MSSGESEYVALSTCAREVSWLRKLFYEICTQSQWNDSVTMNPAEVEIDSTAAISIAIRKDTTVRTKHVDLKYHHVKEFLQIGVITTLKVDTQYQVADCMTKIGTKKNIGVLIKMCRMDTEV